MTQVHAVRETLVPLLNNSGRQLLRSIFHDPLHAALVSHMRAMADTAGVFVPSADMEAAASYCQHASVLIVMDWLCGNGATDPNTEPEALAETLSTQLELHTKGLLAMAIAR